MRTAGNAGGNAPDAMMCLTPISPSRLSKYCIVLVRTCAAPTVSRGLHLLTQREVDELVERLLQRCGRIEAGMIGAERHVGAEKGAWVRLEEGRDAAQQRLPIGMVSGRPVQAGTANCGVMRHARPEFLEPLEAFGARIAGDDAGVDGADRGADDPVGLDAVLVQRVVDAGLVGAERAAALEHEHDLAGSCDCSCGLCSSPRRASAMLATGSLTNVKSCSPP